MDISLPNFDFLDVPLHGGTDASGPARWDFSSNSNACGPCPMALTAMQQADPSRYPDPAYTELRATLAEFHGVTPNRLVLTASASEAICRLTAWLVRSGCGNAPRVSVPLHAYGDYAHAARAWGLEVVQRTESASLAVDTDADLHWYCDPSSPTGQHTPVPLGLPRGLTVLDRAYYPLRLHTEGNGDGGWPPEILNALWQLFSPNKALGLTGVRAAYLIAPLGAEQAVQGLKALAPSWPVGAHGVALLQAWCHPASQTWLAHSLHTLRRWKSTQIALCQAQGWTVLPSQTNFFCTHDILPSGAPLNAWTDLLAHLRAKGIKVRDGASFGLPGHLRWGVLTPAAQQALRLALLAL